MMQSRKTLTARSVILSMLLGTKPPRLPTLLLVRSCELFGISEGTARVALSRMVSAGEVAAGDGGYALTGRLLRRQARQEASRAAKTRAWRGGRWLTAVVTGGARSAADRNELREAMADRRLAELREGVWLRPDNLDIEPIATDVCTWFRSVPQGDAGELAAALWDLGGWADEAGQLRSQLAELLPRLEQHDTTALAPGFVVSAAVLRHFQADPLLPTALLPADWIGPELRTEYDRFDAAYRKVLGEWFRANWVA